MKRKRMSILVLIALLIALLLAGCSENQTTEENNGGDGDNSLGTLTTVDTRTVSYTVRFGMSEQGIFSSYRDLGKFDSAEEFNTQYEEYISPIIGAIRKRGVMLQESAYNDPEEKSPDRRSYTVFNEGYTIGYTLSATKGGYQAVQLSSILYKNEFAKENDSDLVDVINRISDYIGIIVEYDEVLLAMDSAKERAEEGGTYSVVLTNEENTQSVTVSVMDFKSDHESWSIESTNIIGLGERPSPLEEEEG